MNVLPLVLTVFFPLFTQIWKVEPPLSDACNVPFAVSFMTQDAVRAQIKIYQNSPAPDTRSMIVRDLAKANNPAAFAELAKIEHSEKHAAVHDDILRSMAELSQRNIAKADPNRMKALFKSDSPFARAEAVKLYLDAGGNGSAVFDFLETESVDFVIQDAFDSLAKTAKPMPASSAKKFFSSQNRLLKASALGYVAASADKPDSIPDLKSALENKDPLIRARLAIGLASNPSSSGSLLKILSLDPSTPVRIAAAGIKSFSPEKEAILRSLMKDPNDSVRAEAASCGPAKETETRKSLVGLLDDKDWLVRNGAVRSLVAAELSPDRRNEIISLMKSSPRARLASVKVIHGSKVTEAVPDLIALLKEKQTEGIIPAVIQALGDLSKPGDASAVNAMLPFADSKDNTILQALAKSLGQLNVPKSYPTLKKLAKHPSFFVSIVALTYMGKIADPTFQSDFTAAMRNLSGNTDIRIAGIWGISKLGNPLQKAEITFLTKLATTACIPVPQSPPMFDSNPARASAAMALMLAAKRGDAGATEAFSSVCRILCENQSDAKADEVLAEFLRQIQCEEKARQPEPVPVPSFAPELSVCPSSNK